MTASYFFMRKFYLANNILLCMPKHENYFKKESCIQCSPLVLLNSMNNSTIHSKLCRFNRENELTTHVSPCYDNYLYSSQFCLSAACFWTILLQKINMLTIGVSYIFFITVWGQVHYGHKTTGEFIYFKCHYVHKGYNPGRKSCIAQAVIMYICY